MNERERHLLRELLAEAETPPSNEAYTALNERELLDAAHAAGPITLASESDEPRTTGLVSDVAAFVQRHPLPSALAAAGFAYMLIRRRH